MDRIKFLNIKFSKFFFFFIKIRIVFRIVKKNISRVSRLYFSEISENRNRVSVYSNIYSKYYLREITFTDHTRWKIVGEFENFVYSNWTLEMVFRNFDEIKEKFLGVGSNTKVFRDANHRFPRFQELNLILNNYL